MTPKLFKLNVGGSRYDVSDTLLEQFPDSMLRKITSDRWNESYEEIFIERDGGRFEFILDYMRDRKVTLPLSISRMQLLSDMEYYGIDFDESSIILDVADHDDIFKEFSEFFHLKRKFKDIFEPKRRELDISYRALEAESIAHEIASNFFERLFSDRPSFTFVAKELHIGCDMEYLLNIEELQPYLSRYGLKGCNLRFEDRREQQFRNIKIKPFFLNIKVECQRIDPGEIRNLKKDEKITQRKGVQAKSQMVPKRIKLNVGGTRYEVSDSLLDRFKDSMLRRIASGRSYSKSSDSSDTVDNDEIFIDRDGGRFRYVLDYMRDGKVALPLTVLRTEIISEMEYFGIYFDESQITLGVADPDDIFHKYSKFFHQKESFKRSFDCKKRDIESRYRKVSVESTACFIASEYFEQQFSGMSPFTFGVKTIHVHFSNRKERKNYLIEELEPHLNRFGLTGSDVEQREQVDKDASPSKDSRIERVEEPSYIEVKVKMI